MLEYRLSAIVTATQFLRQAQIPLPFGQVCGQFDQESFIGSKEVQDRRQFWTSLLKEVTSNDAIIPRSLTSHWPYWKPCHYVAAAIFRVTVNGLEEAQPMLETLRAGQLVPYLRPAFYINADLPAVAARTVASQNKSLESVGRVRESKRNWFASMGKRLRSRSPRERTSAHEFAGRGGDPREEPIESECR
jgi:hypothetical protein